MLNKINFRNIYMSFWLGAIIGSIAMITLNGFDQNESWLMSIMLSGVIGLLIGGVVECITAILPISIAKPSLFFFINNILAILITILFILSYNTIFSPIAFSTIDLIKVIGIAIIIIAIANTFDYMSFKKTNKRLKEYQSRKGSDE